MIKSINLVKLNAMRDAHTRLHSAYKDVAERSRVAQAEATQLRNFAAGGAPEQKAAAAQYLALPIAELLKVSADLLTAARIDPRYVQRLAAAQTRADALKAEAAELAPALRRSGLLISKINEYAAGAEV
jgi:hypothetical protein